ncbi:ImmA/IrrE family metallo-endopeptidase [Gordonia sputi]|uniref:ImmA/IrrE family metallo-endopeptidase n=1 Tax=Gordonia sputi TaxID=36823 RepID=UPI002042E751|nr:ImmA/IrrE family metallo-endopeptidase [Gordonia sputi]MCM3895783.1 ImmA/IrrE family metallo-endopeptidase [Gordonia sputi]
MNLNQCVELVFGVVPATVRDEFVRNPITAVQDGLGLTVVEARHLGDQKRNDGGACDGVSFLKDGVILYAPSDHSRRQNFTLAHELGHWAFDGSPDEIQDWIADEDDSAKLIETVCDRIAARLLVPSDSVTAVIRAGPVRADHLRALFDATQASRPACAIALANRLPGLGAVVIIDRRTGEITHASVRPDPGRGWPKVYPWRGQFVSSTHPLMRLAPGANSTRRGRWEMPWGTSAEFYIDAVADNRWTFAVFSAIDLWAVDSFHARDNREFDARPTLTGYCCGTEFKGRGFPCSECGKPFCPKCGLCKCDRDAEREVRCDGCFMTYLPHLLEEGLCENCR